MVLFILFLNKEEYLEDVLTLFVELGISGATVLESVGMGHILSHDVPIFAGFRDLFKVNRPHNRTVLAVIEESVVQDLANGLEIICGSFDEPGTGVFLTVPIDQLWGIKKDSLS
jgi:nitrogen regulatory protein P-II 1